MSLTALRGWAPGERGIDGREIRGGRRKEEGIGKGQGKKERLKEGKGKGEGLSVMKNSYFRL